MLGRWDLSLKGNKCVVRRDSVLALYLADLISPLSLCMTLANFPAFSCICFSLNSKIRRFLRCFLTWKAWESFFVRFNTTFQHLMLVLPQIEYSSVFLPYCLLSPPPAFVNVDVYWRLYLRSFILYYGISSEFSLLLYWEKWDLQFYLTFWKILIENWGYRKVMFFYLILHRAQLVTTPKCGIMSSAD